MADRPIRDGQHFPFGTRVTRRPAKVCTNPVPCSSFLCVFAALRDSFSCPQFRRCSTQSRQDAKEEASVDSVPATEWNETSNKAKGLLKVIELTEARV